MWVWSQLFFMPPPSQIAASEPLNAAFKMSEINACARNPPTAYSAQASGLHEIPHVRVSPHSCLHIIRGISSRLRTEGWSGAGLFGGVPDRWSATLLSNGGMSLKTPSSNPIPKRWGVTATSCRCPWNCFNFLSRLFCLFFFFFRIIIILLSFPSALSSPGLLTTCWVVYKFSEVWGKLIEKGRWISYNFFIR